MTTKNKAARAAVAEQQAQWAAQLRSLTGVPYKGWMVLKAAEIYAHLGIPPHEQASASHRVAQALRVLGWARVYTRVGGECMYVWRRSLNYEVPPESLTARAAPAPQASPFSAQLPPEPPELPTVIPGRYVGSIELNGETVALDSDLGKRLVLACAKHDENLYTVEDLRLAFDLTEGGWDTLKWDRTLQKAVRSLIESRAESGLAGDQKAHVYSGSALDTLQAIHRDRQAPASARAAAAATVVKAAGVGAGAAAGPRRGAPNGPWIDFRIGGRQTSPLPDGVESELRFEINLGTAPAPDPIIDVTPVPQP
jgi:hypothetical protein